MTEAHANFSFPPKRFPLAALGAEALPTIAPPKTLQLKRPARQTEALRNGRPTANFLFQPKHFPPLLLSNQPKRSLFS